MLVWVAVGRDVAVISALISHPRHEGWKVDSMFVSVHGIGQLKIVVCLQSWLCGGYNTVHEYSTVSITLQLP